MIIKEWKCPYHGFFESPDPVCPHGCEAGVMRVFLTPVAIGTGVVGRIDQEAQKLTTRFGMSDMRAGVVEGEAQKSAPTNEWAPHFVEFGKEAVAGLDPRTALPLANAIPMPTPHIARGMHIEGQLP